MTTAFILAAGYGTRLAPLTDYMPKALFPVVDKPALQLVIERLYSHGIRNFYINAHHHARMVADFAAQRGAMFADAEVHVVVEEREILGTAGGLGNLFRVAGEPQETILIHNGDIIEDFDIAGAYEFHKSRNAAMTMILVDNPDTNSVCTDGGKVVGFSQGDGLTYSGVAFIEPAMLASFPHDKFASLTDCIKKWLGARAVYAMAQDKFWRDFGTLAQYLELHRRILMDGESDSAHAGARVWISPDANVHPDAEIAGFAAIGARAIIGKCKIANCIVWQETRLSHGEYYNAIVAPQTRVDI